MFALCQLINFTFPAILLNNVKLVNQGISIKLSLRHES